MAYEPKAKMAAEPSSRPAPAVQTVDAFALMQPSPRAEWLAVACALAPLYGSESVATETDNLIAAADARFGKQGGDDGE